MVAAVLVAQFAVPLLALTTGQNPNRLGFQMYSGLGSVSAKVIDSTGAERAVDLSHVAAKARPELDWTSRLPSYLCASEPDAARVTVRQVAQNADGTDRIRSVECER